jgi:hypothetical protein
MGAASGPLVPQTPVLAQRCRLGASQTSLLVTEWNAAEKANLQALLGGGAVAVQFSGCEMRLLPNCRLPGRYMWIHTTATSDRVEIENDAQLYAKLPLGAVSLSGELRKWGKLTVETTVSGQVRLDGMMASQISADPSCAEATHLVDGLSLGAFALSAGGLESSKGGVNVARVPIEGGGQLSQSASVVRAAGNATSCQSATDQQPNADCASPIQVFLAPIPGRAEPEGPPGTVRVDFVSRAANARWDVIINDQATCTTPCSRWVDPSRPVSMRTREDAPQKVEVNRLETGIGPLQVAAKPREQGKFATGVTFTSLGGIAVVTGISLMGVGCSTDRSTMCLAGGLSLGAGALATAGSIAFLLLPSLSSVKVQPLFGGETGMILGTGRTF